MKAYVDIVGIYSPVLIEQHYTMSSLPMTLHHYSEGNNRQFEIV